MVSSQSHASRSPLVSVSPISDNGSVKSFFCFPLDIPRNWGKNLYLKMQSQLSATRRLDFNLMNRRFFACLASALYFFVCGTPSAFSQVPGGPGTGSAGEDGGGAHWKKTVTPNGAFSWSWNYNPPPPSMSQSGGDSEPWWTEVIIGIVYPFANFDCMDSGSIHYRFEWIAPNGEKAPKKVIVHKTSTASWWAPSAYGDGFCTSSLEGTPAFFDDGYEKSGNYFGEEYSIEDSSTGLVEFDITTMAVASGNGVPNVPQSWGTVGCGAGSDADITSVLIKINGTVKHDGKWKCLTGDRISASLDTGKYLQITDSHNWSATGSHFKDFYITQSTNVPTESTGNRRYHVTSELKQSNFTLHYFDNGSSKISCSAQVATPKGPLSLSTESENITIVRPPYTLDIVKGGVFLNSSQLIAANGLHWDATTTLPAPFSLRMAELGISQNISPGRKEWKESNPPPMPPSPYPGNGLPGLDNTFPYSKQNSIGTIVHSDGDSPGNALAGLVRVECSDSFEDWLIFRPIGGEWISLATFKWSWEGSAEKSANAWNLLFPPLPKVNFDGTYTDTTNHPNWNRRHANSGPVSPQ